MTENYIIPRKYNGQPWTRGRMANVHRLTIQVDICLSIIYAADLILLRFEII